MMASQTIAPSDPSSMKMLTAMVGIGVFCALLIVLTFEGTLPRIKRLQTEALEKAVFKVLPGTTHTRAFQFDENQGFSQASGNEESMPLVYAGFDGGGNLTGVAIEASGQGYADILRILYGYSPRSQTIIGLQVLESRETPGLGDKIEKDPDFVANFANLDVSLTDDFSQLKNNIVPVKHGTKENPWEVDGITGATISSRAIGNIIGASTQYWVPLIYGGQEDFILKEEAGHE